MQENLIDKIEKANKKVLNAMIASDPVWIDIKPAIEVAEGMKKNMILHSGPPISWDDMCGLHRNGIVSGILYEGLAKDKNEAIKLIENGKIEIESALDHNVVGPGAGIVTASVSLMVIKDRISGKIGCTPPSEGVFRGGLCSWGLYSKEIEKNLHLMRDVIFPPIVEMLKKRGGVNLKPIIAQGLQMGDENHTRQVAEDGVLIKEIMSDLVRQNTGKDTLIKCIDYLTKTERLFHSLGMSASLATLLAASNIKYSTIVVVLSGNGVEFGIKISGLKDKWFTAPAPIIKGRFLSAKYTEKDILPWCGDSCVVEAAGLGGFAVAASPIVMLLRGKKVKDAVDQTNKMRKICLGENTNYPIPNIDFALPPIGIDIRKVIEEEITPVSHGGMINREGGLIGAGSANAPLDCFNKALYSFAEEYNIE